MEIKLGNCMVAQSGGPTTVINSSACGVIETALKNDKIDRVYGAKYGIEGILNDDIIDFTMEDPKEIDYLKYTPSSGLGTCRYKLAKIEDDENEYKNIFKIFEKYNIKYFFYIGGNDSMDTVSKLSKYAKKIGSDIRVLGIPKTIDNDLFGTDHTPGFGSAAKYIASSVMEVVRDGNSYNKNIINIIETMGRHAGWLAASSVLANNDSIGAPDLIYLPEVEFSIEKFLNDVKSVYEKKGKVTVVVSEGVQTQNDRLFLTREQSAVTDSFGHKKLGGVCHVLAGFVEEEICNRVKVIEFNVLQRAAMHFASKVDLEEAYMCGNSAIEYALKGETGKMVILNRVQNNPYKCETGLIDVDVAANKEKKIPRSWINEEGNYVTKECIDYIRPLVQGEVNLPMENGVPRFANFKGMRK